jgi:DNA-binding NarL/FixJ family response regulator
VKRILIVDSQPLMREALRQVVRTVWSNVHIFEAGCYGEAERVSRSQAAIDLVVMDPALPDVEGLSGLIMLQKVLPASPIVVFSSSRDPQVAASSYALGAAAQVPKSALMSEVVSTLRKAASGERVFVAAEPLPAGLQTLKQTKKRLDSLSPAQMRVLVNVAGGRLNKQVAADMNVTEATIKAHMTAIFRKLKVINRAQAILAVQPLLRERLAA